MTMFLVYTKNHRHQTPENSWELLVLCTFQYKIHNTLIIWYTDRCVWPLTEVSYFTWSSKSPISGQTVFSIILASPSWKAFLPLHQLSVIWTTYIHICVCFHKVRKMQTFSLSVIINFMLWALRIMNYCWSFKLHFLLP